MRSRHLKELAVETYSEWSGQNAPRLGAALAYYTLLSIAPLTILVVAICGIIFDKPTAERDVLLQTQNVIGSGAASALRMMLENAHQPGTGIVATLVALITLLFGASGVFMELRDALNTIWQAPARDASGWKGMVWQRLSSFAMVLSLGILLLASLLFSAAFAFFQKFATGLIPLPTAIVGEILNVVLSLAGLAILFALIFKFVPDVPVDWRDVTIGAGVTALLFMVGKSLLALYLGTAGVGSTYGAAGSLVAFVVWIYYSAQIFFFGAVFTRIYSLRFGSHASGKTTGNSTTASQSASAVKQPTPTRIHGR